MPLIKYIQYLTYPDGTAAVDTAFPVVLLGGNVPVPVFADKAGTAPLANPVMTDSAGLLTFYAAPGSFVADVAGAVFHFQVDEDEPDAAWPGTFVHTQLVAASVWTVDHHFGTEPTVENLVLSEPVAAQVSHTNSHTTVITFSSPTAGAAHLRR